MTATEQREKAVAWALAVADDNSHGYGWGGWGPDYDCGHLIISAWEQAGVPVKTRGASYTGNMPGVFLACGFRDVTASVDLASGAGLRRGDVLVNRSSHAAMFVGGGRLVQARTDLDGRPGDSGGQEIRVQGYYNYPWDCVLRYEDEASGIRHEATGETVRAAGGVGPYGEMKGNSAMNGATRETVGAIHESPAVDKTSEPVGEELAPPAERRTGSNNGETGERAAEGVGPYGETTDENADSAFRIPPSALDPAFRTPNSALVPLPVLRYGDVSEAVRAAQLLLCGRGLSCGPDGADGELGPNTLGAVRAFQRSRGLTPDGAVGRDTWSALLGVTA